MHTFDRLIVRVEDLLHLEVGRGMDSVDECPLMVEGDVGVS